jgi:prevent-host-death family protein
MVAIITLADARRTGRVDCPVERGVQLNAEVLLCSTMERIGIRELRQHASRYIEKAERGEAIEVTNRGRLVARILPATEELTGLAKLQAEGSVRPAKRNHRELPPPLPLPRGARPLSEIVDEMREERL